MASTIRVGQVFRGVRDTYVVAKQLHSHVWAARNSSQSQVVLKTAPQSRLDREKTILQQFVDCPHIRQLLDHGEDPPFLALEHLDDDALRLSGAGKLSRSDIKMIARGTLQALSSLHAMGIAHTDIKPDNILLNLNGDRTAVVDAKLADCGGAWNFGHDTDSRGTGHVIGAAIFRSPEALLGLRWSTPTDMWSFGATLISLLWGRGLHLFKPPNISSDDEEFPVHVLVQQARYFGPFPLSYEGVLDEEQNQILAAVHVHIEEQDLRKPFSLVEDKEVTQKDKDFICRTMQLDPRDRPTADELLADGWFGLL